MKLTYISPATQVLVLTVEQAVCALSVPSDVQQFDKLEDFNWD
jgi:hypothetical protein